MGESASLVKAYVARQGLSFPQLLDGDQSFASMFSVQATPTNFLINRSGRLIGGGAGYRDWATPEVHRLIESLLTGG